MEVMLQLRVFCHRSNCRRERSYGGVLNNPVAGRRVTSRPATTSERSQLPLRERPVVLKEVLVLAAAFALIRPVHRRRRHCKR